MSEEEAPQPSRSGRFKWVALACALVFGLLFMAGHFHWSLPEVKLPEFEGPFRGFYRGKVASDNTLWFIFYEHPQWGLQPLLDGKTLHSNTLKLAVFAPGHSELEVELQFWREEETENGTRIIGLRTMREKVRPMGAYGLIDLELPIHVSLHRMNLVYQGEVIWDGYHQTKRAYLPAPRYTLGSLAVDRMVYISGAAFVCFAAIGAAKEAINRVKAVPKVRSWIVFLALEAIIIIAAASAWWYIYHVALINVAWTYAPIFLSAFIFGVFIMKPTPSTWFFIKFYEGEPPPADIYLCEVVFDEAGQPILADIGWRDFLRGRRKRILVTTAKEEEPAWYIPVFGSQGNRIYYVEEVAEDRWGIRAIVTSMHQMKIEEFKADLLNVEKLSKAYQENLVKLYRVQAEAEKKALEIGSEMAKQYVIKLLEAMGLISKPEEAEKAVETKPREVIIG